ncbi:hypothetical protein BR10RB9215_C10842 [Brucella sp. 10RB9215]|uniref:hypothetical protein n=2 Tax=unclassified Brucella TaxID=2632610 RepID=UPI00090C919E|nr:hypothetical protein [Brucella sp. 10RB9215]SBW14023.1 hypothetical protein BR10RB9215_C10842 [Brucella sp. 10RB9215]
MPEWDVVDNLEADDFAVQWNQYDRSERDDALKDLPGSIKSPELSRMMSLNIYNEKFRFYKKRNLQAAVKRIMEFRAANPSVDVMISFEPDNKLNPWFYWSQWYDYNPNTLRQFREWLSHSGPYAETGLLSGDGDKQNLTITDVAQLANSDWTSWDQVDPPRDRPTNNPWHLTWTKFKRHLVSQHYADLAKWATEAGATKDMLYTTVPVEASTALTDNADGVTWSDVAGVSLQGGKPQDARLGAILYGRNTRDEVPTPNGNSLLNAIRGNGDPWGVVEMSPSDIAFPHLMNSLADSYNTLFQLLNHGAYFISPMTRSDGRWRAVLPERYSSYDSFAFTTFEPALYWWVSQWRDMPAGSVFFPFGLPGYNSNDGWLTGNAELPVVENNQVVIPQGTSYTLVSPTWLEILADEVEVDGDWGDAKMVLRMKFEDGSEFQSTNSKKIIVPKTGAKLTQIGIEWNEITSPSALNEIRVYKRP